MNNNIFDLTPDQLEKIALSLQSRIAEGLEEEGRQIKAIPTYIVPGQNAPKGKVLVLDLGGTNYRVAVVDFGDIQSNGMPAIHPVGGNKYKISPAAMKSETLLYKEIIDPILSTDLTGVSRIGFCFSFPATCTPDGDAIPIEWTKGFDIGSMLNKPIGKALMERLNKALKKKGKKVTITKVNVINDTVASLFSGLAYKADGHIGLIVGTGTNMATFVDTKYIKKPTDKKGLLPINLESGNFHPPHLLALDDKIDRHSDTPGRQRFEKAISGLYLGRIMEYVFSCDPFEDDFNAFNLTHIMSYPQRYQESYVTMAHQIYERSAKLVAASLAGLIDEMAALDPSIKTIRLMADGSLFWSKDLKGRDAFPSYKNIVMAELDTILKNLGLTEIKVTTEYQDDINLVGSAIAGLS